MRTVVTDSQMREIDRFAMDQIGIPSMVLMERAALSVAEAIEARAGKEDRIWAACGSGNNGADGIAVSRMLYLKGYQAGILLMGERERGSREYLAQLSIAQKVGVPILESSCALPEGCELLIDAVFGVGLNREIEGALKERLELLKRWKPKATVAVDIPSGINGDTGQIMGIALKADLTITFGYEKLGTMLYPGKEYSGRVLVADIGFPPCPLLKESRAYFTLEEGDENLLPDRPAYSNKGSFGRVLIAAGSRNMSGAAYLSALAAYRTGAGLVKIFTDHENREILQTKLPEAILTTYAAEEAEKQTEAFQALLKAQCQWADVIVLGPGIGRGPDAVLVTKGILENALVPVILDADGLNIVAEHPELTNYFNENTILTPHLGEMARLTKTSVEHIRTHLISTAREYADRLGVTCLLKDAVTIGALKDKSTYVASSGNSAMAKAGSGDVLTGIIAGLVAMGMETGRAAAFGSWLHGRAGDLVREKSGAYSLLAGELAEEIPTILKMRMR